jgi:hypothetical protein
VLIFGRHFSESTTAGSEPNPNPIYNSNPNLNSVGWMADNGS